jgi:voltage-gated potassium channel
MGAKSAAAAAASFEGSTRDRLEPSDDTRPFLVRLARDPLLTLANSKSLLALTLALVLAAGTASQMVLEGTSFGDGLWWAVVTASTVGYGDISPTTGPGRVVAGLMIATMVLLVVPLVTAQILSHLVRDENAFTHTEQETIKEDLKAVRAQLDEVTTILRGQGGAHVEDARVPRQDAGPRDSAG